MNRFNQLSLPRLSRQQERALLAYLEARETVLRRGFAHEIDWQEECANRGFTEREFLREAAWVILSSGMREGVVRLHFAKISRAFHGWQSASLILDNAWSCREEALKSFRHRGKVDAILNSAEFLEELGVSVVQSRIAETGPEILCDIDFIGPITCYHLAKNLGYVTSKPDRHLTRIARCLGYPDTQRLCSDLSVITEHLESVIDLVFWRYATLTKDYELHLTQPTQVPHRPLTKSDLSWA